MGTREEPRAHRCPTLTSILATSLEGGEDGEAGDVLRPERDADVVAGRRRNDAAQQGDAAAHRRAGHRLHFVRSYQH